MRIDVLTLFPEMFGGVLGASMLGRAAEAGLLEFHVHDIRAYTENKHKKADDYPFGGGAGLVMMAQPIFDCMEAVCAMDARPGAADFAHAAWQAVIHVPCACAGGAGATGAALRPL